MPRKRRVQRCKRARESLAGRAPFPGGAQGEIGERGVERGSGREQCRPVLLRRERGGELTQREAASGQHCLVQRRRPRRQHLRGKPLSRGGQLGSRTGDDPALGDHGRQHRQSRRPIDLPAEIGKGREIVREQLDRPAFEVEHRSPSSLGKRSEQEHDIVIGCRGRIPARSRSGKDDCLHVRMPQRHEATGECNVFFNVRTMVAFIGAHARLPTVACRIRPPRLQSSASRKRKIGCLPLSTARR
ncbi:MAG TPA: hypothetical protein VGF77_17730 [Allosphingosinicella sp.]